MKNTFFLSVFLLTICSTSQAQINLAADINPGTESSEPTMLTPFNGKLYMVSSYYGVYGFELFSYDGTNPASLVYDLAPGAVDGINTYEEHKPLPVLDGKLYFSGRTDAGGYKLMRIEGSGVPSLAGSDLVPGTTNQLYLTLFNNKIYFSAILSSTGFELFVYDPITNTTSLLSDIEPGSGGSNPGYFTPFQNKLYFSAQNSATGYELYSYDPTTNATSLVADIALGTEDSDPEQLTVIGNNLYFLATTPSYGQELYRYDGNSVIRCTDVNPGPAHGVEYFSALYNGEIYFSGRDGTSSSNRLFTYNPTTNTTALKYVIDPTIQGFYSRGFTIYGGRLYFFASTSVAGAELWVTDGITTNMVQDLFPGSSSAVSYLSEITVWNGKLYFTAFTNEYGIELFQLSTPEGTSIRNVSFKGDASIAPNPSHGNATLFLDLKEAQSLQISITDVNGRPLYHSAITHYQSGKQEVILPIFSFVAGNYFYKITNAKGGTMLSGKLNKL